MYRVYGYYLRFVLPAAVLVGLALAAWQVQLPWYVWFLILPALATAAFLGLSQMTLAREEARLSAQSPAKDGPRLPKETTRTPDNGSATADLGVESKSKDAQ